MASGHYIINNRGPNYGIKVKVTLQPLKIHLPLLKKRVVKLSVCDE